MSWYHYAITFLSLVDYKLKCPPRPITKTWSLGYFSDGSVSLMVFRLHITYPNHPINKIHSCPAILDLNHPDSSLSHFQPPRVLISLGQKKNPIGSPAVPEGFFGIWLHGIAGRECTHLLASVSLLKVAMVCDVDRSSRPRARRRERKSIGCHDEP